MNNSRRNRKVRRSTESHTEPTMPSGWRTSRRATGNNKKARTAIRNHRVRRSISAATTAAKRRVTGLISASAVIALVAVFAIGALWVVAVGINAAARQLAIHAAGTAQTPESRQDKARDNILVVAKDQSGVAIGFLAVRIDHPRESIYAIAIPDATFIEIPGVGFDKVAASWDTGSDVTLDAFSNFFGVPFMYYITVDEGTYQSIVRDQSFSGAVGAIKEENFDEQALGALLSTFEATPTENVAVVPMPVKPITLGQDTYFEPQRDEIADLVQTWWGVAFTEEDAPTRVIIYNGAGLPGIGGEAAQQLIREGFRVIDTKNADRFDYELTKIIVQSGPLTAGEEIASVLGVGQVVDQRADQRIADVIIIIGQDYNPPTESTP